MAVGFIKPHLPWFVPKEFFDMYDINDVKAPIVKENDLDDITNSNGKQTFKPDAEYNWTRANHLEKEAARAYLANVSFVDKCFGVVIEALKKSGHADNTIVVTWGDHGWHLGEKLRYKKNTLWAESVKPPFIIRIPGMEKPIYCQRPVNLIDMYPTLVSLSGLPKKKGLDGHDISPLLENSKAKWKYPGITVSASGTSVLTEKWHYISNLSGSEELYSVADDPMEWNNLITNKKYAKIVSELKKWILASRKKPTKIHFDKPRDYVNADADPTTKLTRDLNKLK